MVKLPFTNQADRRAAALALVMTANQTAIAYSLETADALPAAETVPLPNNG